MKLIHTNEIESKATFPLMSTLPLIMSFRLVRSSSATRWGENLSLFSEGFPTRSACGNDNLCGSTYKLLSNLVLISVLVLCPVSLRAASSTAPDAEHSHGPLHIKSLIDKYQKIKKDPEKSSFAVPFYIESSVSKHASHVDIYGTIEHPFDIVQDELLVPTKWCEILLPHMNVRACTYKPVNDTWLLNIYNVDEFSDPLEDAYQMKFEYLISELQQGYFHILLNAREGPHHTKDHRLELEAIPLDKGRAFLHLRYSFGYSAWVYLVVKLFGGGKTGFSVIGTDSDGNPVYVGGLRGSVERTVVCYYLAILAYLDARNAPAEQRFEKRISQWYDLAGRFKKQLLEMEKEEYLAYKRRDRESQERLQRDLNSSRHHHGADSERGRSCI